MFGCKQTDNILLIKLINDFNITNIIVPRMNINKINNPRMKIGMKFNFRIFQTWYIKIRQLVPILMRHIQGLALFNINKFYFRILKSKTLPFF